MIAVHLILSRDPLREQRGHISNPYEQLQQAFKLDGLAESPAECMGNLNRLKSFPSRTSMPLLMGRETSLKRKIEFL